MEPELDTVIVQPLQLQVSANHVAEKGVVWLSSVQKEFSPYCHRIWKWEKKQVQQ